MPKSRAMNTVAGLASGLGMAVTLYQGYLIPSAILGIVAGTYLLDVTLNGDSYEQ